MGAGSSKNSAKSVEEAEFDFRNSVKRRNLEEMLEEDKDKLSFRPAFLKKEEEQEEDVDEKSTERRPSTIGGWMDEVKGGPEVWQSPRART